MSKISVVARNIKREHMIEKYADRRKQLKAEGRWEELDKLLVILHKLDTATVVN